MGSLTDPRDCSTLVNLMPSQFSQNSFIKCCYGDDNPVEPIPDLRCPLGFAFNDILNVCDDLDECFEGQLHFYFWGHPLTTLTSKGVGGDHLNVNETFKIDSYFNEVLITCIFFRYRYLRSYV